MFRLQPNILTRDATSWHRNCEWQTEEHQNKNSTYSRYCLEATLGDIRGKIKVAIIHNDSSAEATQNTYTPELKQSADVESQTLPWKRTSFQNPQPLRNSSEKLKPGANQYFASISARTVKMKPWKRITTSQLTCIGNDNISFLTKKFPPFGNSLWEMRHERLLYGAVLHSSFGKM